MADALERVLAAPFERAHHLPGFPRSTVDGYAVAAQDTYGASDGLPALLDVVGEVAMGEAAGVRLDEAQCALVHTGGMIPPDADAVVMVEHTQRVGSAGGTSATAPVSLVSPFSPFSIEVYRPVAVGQNVIQIGEDVRRGEQVLPAGHQIRPQDIGGLLALGIVEIDAAIARGSPSSLRATKSYRRSRRPVPARCATSTYTLAALTSRVGGIPVMYPVVPDRLEALQDAARRHWMRTTCWRPQPAARSATAA